MTRRIGYYVHHHGRGHLDRARLIAGEAPDRFVLIGTGLADRCRDVVHLDLPDDRRIDAFDGDDAEHGRPAALHYAPLNHDGVRLRAAAIANWIAKEQPALLVVDVSVEVALLARLLATPTAYVRLSGDRSDTPHLEAFRAARLLLAPFHQRLDEPLTPAWVAEKTVFCPGLTRAAPVCATDERLVLVVAGQGGAPAHGDGLAAAARATPQWRWRVIGPALAALDMPSNLELVGWSNNAEQEIARAGMIVGAAGDGLVNQVLAAHKPFCCLPEARPFDEQCAKARRLAQAGRAVVRDTWPDPSEWAALFDQAAANCKASRNDLHDVQGIARAAEMLLAAADHKAFPQQSARRVSG